MASALDIQITPICRQAGQDLPDLPGLSLCHPPRKAARGRTNDHLILHLALSENVVQGEIDLPSLMTKLETTYYSIPGAISSTLRFVAEDLNAFLLKYNKQTSSRDRRVIAALTQVVIRPESFYMAQSGLAHAFFVSGSGVQHLYDPMFSGQGLGTGQSTLVRFFQGQLAPGDLLLLSAKPSSLWTETSLTVFHGQDMEGMRQRLYDHSMPDISAVLIQARSGEGLIRVFPFQIPIITQPADSGGEDGPGTEVASPGGVIESKMPASQSLESPGEDVEMPLGQQEEQQVLGVPAEKVEAEVISEEKPQTPVPLEQDEAAKLTAKSADQPDSVVNAQPVDLAAKQKIRSPNVLLAMLVAIGEAFNHFFQYLGRNLGRFLGRLFPDELLELSNTAMAVVAILVPIVIVAGASLVYYQLGRAEQGRQYYLQAGDIAASALVLEEPLEKRNELLIALDYLNQVSVYGGVPAVQLDELRFRLQSEIDLLDNIRRVDYQPALVSGFDDSVSVSQMLVSFDDLYLLDAGSGSILRAFKTSLGYQLDDNFKCAPQFATINTGPLVSMVLWDGFDPDATVVAVDRAGNLLFCQPGSDPISEKLSPPSTGAFRSITAITMDRGYLYVLDPPSNAVWVYSIGSLDQEPSYFFGDQPPAIQGSIDLAVNFDELYLLHKDGHLTLCYAFIPNISLPKCNDPQPFTDFRVGRENATYISDTPFSEIFANPAPDPSLYLLEPQNQSVTHFSFRSLGYLREYSPLKPLQGGDATAFVISGVDRLLFLAVDNRVYFGLMP
jgi:hypothetical protein